MTRTRTQAQLEIEALAAIGEAMLFNARGNPETVKALFDQGSRFVAGNSVLKRLTELCRSAAHDPNWRASTEARLRMLGAKHADLDLRDT